MNGAGYSARAISYTHKMFMKLTKGKEKGDTCAAKLYPLIVHKLVYLSLQGRQHQYSKAGTYPYKEI
jgi:hypothetical protein